MPPRSLEPNYVIKVCNTLCSYCLRRLNYYVFCFVLRSSFSFLFSASCGSLKEAWARTTRPAKSKERETEAAALDKKTTTQTASVTQIDRSW